MKKLLKLSRTFKIILFIMELFCIGCVVKSIWFHEDFILPMIMAFVFALIIQGDKEWGSKKD